MKPVQLAESKTDGTIFWDASSVSMVRKILKARVSIYNNLYILFFILLE